MTLEEAIIFHVEMAEDFAGTGTIKVWVGNESVEYYQAEANKWVADHKTKNAEFNMTVTVEGSRIIVAAVAYRCPSNQSRVSAANK